MQMFPYENLYGIDRILVEGRLLFGSELLLCEGYFLGLRVCDSLFDNPSPFIAICLEEIHVDKS